MAKYGSKGWIKLWRSNMDDPWYDLEPFTKWQAWIDLCMMADSNGTVKTSLEALKNRWLWGSRMKVARYLETLNETGRGTVKSTPYMGTLIRINTGFSADRSKPKKKGNETVNETVSVTEELLPKEVDGASLAMRTSNNIEKNRLLEDELSDEYV